MWITAERRSFLTHAHMHMLAVGIQTQLHTLAVSSISLLLWKTADPPAGLNHILLTSTG